MPKLINNFQTLVAQKEQRAGKRFKQKEIAQAIGVSESMVSRWMKGKDLDKTNLQTAAKVAEWLECEIGDLVQIDREAT